MRRTAIVLGTSLLLGAPLAAATVACSCGPTPPPPTMQTCSDVSAPTVTSAVPVTTPDRGGGAIADGDPVPSYFGAQGGEHVQIAVRLEGSGFGACIAQRSELLDTDGNTLDWNDRNTPLTLEGSIATTGAILLFPSYVPGGAILRVEIAGQTIERRLGTAATLDPDAGFDSGTL